MQLYNKEDKNILKNKMRESQVARITLSFYQYHSITDPQSFRDELFIALDKHHVLGRIYVAQEGINGQISVPESSFEAFKIALYSFDFLNDVRLNIAVEDDGKSFFKLLIKVRSKIVADGLEDEKFDASNCGTHLDAKSFNELTDQEDAIIVDMRNHYESEVGHFKEAILPDADTFRDALPMVEEIIKGKEDKHIVMYCTGGIRCEKASAYFKHKGFENVYQLEGGIIKYAQDAKDLGIENKYIGKNFVFDERLGERISEDVISKCHQCGASCDTHTNCKNDACHLLFIQCDSCAGNHEGCCSEACNQVIKLPEEKQKEIRQQKDLGRQVFKKGRWKTPAEYKNHIDPYEEK
ncbi:MAG: rhodanese-related sulfurtransferase [Cyclobacteriaceae bacterium]